MWIELISYDGGHGGIWISEDDLKQMINPYNGGIWITADDLKQMLNWYDGGI